MSLFHPSSFCPHPSDVAVVKVGGSLYDLPDLGPRLRRWLAEQFAGTGVVLIPGGGALVEAIRHLDQQHGLGEETSHWLALRALSINAYFLASLLPRADVIGDLDELCHVWDKGSVPILDVHEFARADECRSGHLPHSWDVTSDSFAARVAIVLKARHLVLIKSTTIPAEMNWPEAARLGMVDALFGETLHDAPAELCVHAVNLRTD